MSLKTFVKIGRITNLSDARYCAGMMVDVIGFNLIKGQEDYVDQENFSAITGWISGPQIAGEFGNASVDKIKTALESYQINIIESENTADTDELTGLGLPIFLKIQINDAEELDQLPEKLNILKAVDKVIIACAQQEYFAQIDQLLGEIETQVPLIKSYNITEDNLNNLSFWKGIELTATPEDHLGFKDYGKIMDILELLEED